MGMQKCLVSICGQATKTFALPTDAQLKTVWLTRAGFKGNITGNLKVCPKHFNPLCLKQDGKGLGLVKGAVPSLHLPGYSVVGNSTDNFWFPPQQNVRIPEKIKDILTSFPLGQTSLTPSTSTELKVQIPIRVYGRRSQPFIDSETAFMLQPSTSQAVDDVLDPPVGPSKDRVDMKQTVIKDEIEIHDDFICNTKVKQELSDEVYSVAFQNVNTISTRPIKQEISDDLNTIQLFEQSMVTIKTEECPNMVDKPKIPNNFEYSRIKSGKKTKSQGSQKCLKHLILNSINGIIICELCGNLYTKRIEFIRHFSIKHCTKQEFYQTNKCSKKKEKTDTAVNRNVDVDVKNETVEDGWKKEEDIRFAANFTSSIYECQNLKRNDANTTKNFFKCDICLKNFSPKSGLKTHLCSHTEEKRNSHVRTHTGKKPFRCDICQKTFLMKRNLNIHLCKHTRKKSVQM